MVPRSKNKVVNFVEHAIAYGLMAVIGCGLVAVVILKPVLHWFHIDILD
jgi:hypothetical protein